MDESKYDAGVVCSVVDETGGTMPWEVTYCETSPARLHPQIGAGIAVCEAHELDPRVTVVSYRGTTRVVIPQDERR
jgi:hypothetical protein